jgi:hypothetical protein
MRISRRDPVALVDWRRCSQQPIRSVAMRWRSMAVSLGSRPGFLQKRHCRSFLAKSSKLEVARSWRSLVGGDAGSLVRHWRRTRGHASLRRRSQLRIVVLWMTTSGLISHQKPSIVFVHRRRRCAILMLEKRRSGRAFLLAWLRWRERFGDQRIAISSRPVLIRFFC